MLFGAAVVSVGWMTAGGWVGAMVGCEALPTLTVQDALTSLSLLQVIVATPSRTPVTKPSSLTVAIFGSLLSQLSATCDASAGL